MCLASVKICVQAKRITDIKMAACSDLYNSLYKQVRLIGLPYEIKESGGSILIKISANLKQQSFKKENEKIRFHNERTLNGSDNLNWRKPHNYFEKSVQNSPSFPNLQFFQTTPPPQRPCPPPTAKPSTTLRPPPPSAASELWDSPNLGSYDQPKFVSTPAFNPYRCENRKIIFPKTPSLSTSSITASSSDLVSSATTFTPALPPSLQHAKPPEADHFLPANYEPLVKVMKAIYEGMIIAST